MTRPPLLELSGLSRHFGGLAAVQDVGFGVAAGDVHALIGPNGAGKTTLFNLIAGVLLPSAGQIRLAGRDITWLPIAARARVGLQRSFQNLQIFRELSALENVMVGGHLHTTHGFLAGLLGLASRRADAALRTHCAELMHRVGLGAQIDAPSAALSYGQLKRLEIARALAARPVLLLLDEPAAGLNAVETAALDTLIRRIVADGLTVLLVEHDMKLVMGLADRVSVLDQGRLIAQGTPAEMRQNPAVLRAYLGTGKLQRRRA